MPRFNRQPKGTPKGGEFAEKRLPNSPDLDVDGEMTDYMWKFIDDRHPDDPRNRLFDFNDGRGPVSAHRHRNGGGWVEEGATVDDDAYISQHSAVMGNAKLLNGAQLMGYSTLTGDDVIDGKTVFDYTSPHTEEVPAPKKGLFSRFITR